MTLDQVFVWAKQAWVLWGILTFLGIALWAFWPRNKDRFERNGMIPFKDESNGG